MIIPNPRRRARKIQPEVKCKDDDQTEPAESECLSEDEVKTKCNEEPAASLPSRVSERYNLRRSINPPARRIERVDVRDEHTLQWGSDVTMQNYCELLCNWTNDLCSF